MWCHACGFHSHAKIVWEFEPHFVSSRRIYMSKTPALIARGRWFDSQLSNIFSFEFLLVPVPHSSVKPIQMKSSMTFMFGIVYIGGFSWAGIDPHFGRIIVQEVIFGHSHANIVLFLTKQFKKHQTLEAATFPSSFWFYVSYGYHTQLVFLVHFFSLLLQVERVTSALC